MRKARQAEYAPPLPPPSPLTPRAHSIPGWLLRRMLMNNAASALVGLLPVAGDVVLAAFKANSRNAALLEEFLRIRGEEFLRLQAGGAGPSAQQNGAGAGGVTQHDAEQVLPGAGREKGEAVEGAAVDGARTMPGGLAASGKSQRSLLSWGRGKGKGKAVEAGERGRFVEDVPPGAGKA